MGKRNKKIDPERNVELKRLLRRREVNRKGFVVRDDAVKMAEEPLGNRKMHRKGRIHTFRGRPLLGKFYRTVQGGLVSPR